MSKLVISDLTIAKDGKTLITAGEDGWVRRFEMGTMNWRPVLEQPAHEAWVNHLALSADGKLLVLANGAYGLRAAKTLEYLGRACHLLDKGDYLPPRGAEVAEILAADPAITHVLAIHCETSSGILNPIEEIA